MQLLWPCVQEHVHGNLGRGTFNWLFGDAGQEAPIAMLRGKRRCSRSSVSEASDECRWKHAPLSLRKNGALNQKAFRGSSGFELNCDGSSC